MNRSHQPRIIFYSRLLLLMLTLLPNVIFATTQPSLTPFEVDYDISRSGLVIIHTQRRLLQLGVNEYLFESNSRTAGPISWFIKDRISENSRWQYHQLQPRPLHYHYQLQGGRRKKHIELNFDWLQNIVSDSERKPVWSSKVTPPTTDKLLYQLQLMLDLQTGRKVFNYTIADSGKIQHYDFKHSGTETIEIPLGSFDTIKLHRRNGKRATTIWFAPALDYLPIRIEHLEKDGSVMQANATRVNGLPTGNQNETQLPAPAQ